LAWTRIEQWSQSYVEQTSDWGEEIDGRPNDNDLLQRLERSLELGSMVMKALEEELLPYRDDGNSFRARSKAIWNQATLRCTKTD